MSTGEKEREKQTKMLVVIFRVFHGVVGIIYCLADVVLGMLFQYIARTLSAFLAWPDTYKT
jgi:hypothetical protein